MSLFSPASPQDWKPAFSALTAIETGQRFVATTIVRARLPLALTGGLLAALAVWAALLPTDRAPPVPGDPDTVPLAWSRSTDRAPRFAWKSPAFAGVSESQERWTRTGPSGEETDDRLMLGDADGAGPFALLFATRASAQPADASFYLSTVRAAAKFGILTGRVPQPTSHEGRFGPTETAPVSLSPIARTASTRETCLAWRAAATTSPGPSLTGFVCMPSSSPVDAVTLECLLAGLSSADGVVRRLPETPACRERLAALTASRVRTAVARTRQ